jgi:porin
VVGAMMLATAPCADESSAEAGGGDRFGVAAFYLGVSDDLKDGLRRDRLGDEYGGEMFYNLAVTRWFRMTADLQVISPALGDSPVVLLGWRAQLRF